MIKLKKSNNNNLLIENEVGIMEIDIRDLDQLVDFIMSDHLKKKEEVKEGNDPYQEIVNLQAMVKELHKILGEANDKHKIELETITQRLRAAHFFDLRTHMKTMDHLVNLTSRVNQSPLKDQ